MKIYKRILLSSTAIAALACAAVSAQTTWQTNGNAVVSGNFLGSTNNADVIFKTNNIERGRITGAGDFGIGITTPASLMHVQNNGAPQLRLSDNRLATDNVAWDFWAGTNLHFRRVNGAGISDWIMFEDGAHAVRIGPTSQFFVNLVAGQVGNVGIGTTSTTAGDKLTVAGGVTPATDGGGNIGSSSLRWNAIWASNGTINTSDARMKENVSDIEYGLDAVLMLHPISYTWKDDPAWGTKLGLLAQEVQGVIPEVVKGDEDGTSMGIFYSQLIPVLIKAVQEQEDIAVDNAETNGDIRKSATALDQRLAKIEEALQSVSGVDAPELSSNGVMLDQNDPNPSDESTSISYAIPASVAKADLVISEIATGREMKRITLQERGTGRITLPLKEFRSGSYLYSIIADGKVAASRKMLVAR